MNLHLAFFSLDLLGYSKERFIQQTLANFGSKNFFLVIVPSSRNGTTVRDFVRTFCEQDIAWRWNIRAYTCDKHGPRLEEAFTGGRR